MCEPLLGDSKGARSQRRYTVRPRGRFPGSNFCQVLPKILAETRVDNIILQTPANDITNLENQIVEADEETIKNKVGESSKVMAYLAG